MTAAGLLGAEDSGLIDIDGIAWFLGTSTAALIREAGNAFHREFAFVAAEPVSSQLSSVPVQPDDFVMVRGIVDGVLSHGDHMSIIDFKSDSVEADEVAVRAMRYTPQLRMYARAMRRLWGLPVPDGELVFLSARAIHTVELSD
jgi:ATP-dependent exoDNAse (exonuclease V) beta subunit